jgi:apolipoprotein N-acyltransferase
MVKSVPLEKEGFLTVSVPSSPSAGSFYSIYGNIFAWTCLALWAALCVAAVRGTRITSSLA